MWQGKRRSISAAMAKFSSSSVNESGISENQKSMALNG